MADDKSVESTNEPEATEAEDPKISLFLTIGLVVGALIIGLVVGYALIPKGSDVGAPAGDIGTPGAPAGSAPQLTPDQLEGQLPSGHPPVPGSESSGAPEADGAEDQDAPTSDTSDTGDGDVQAE